MLFRDRTDAALLLAEQLNKYKNTNSIVLAVPRGGVPVAHHIANLLHLPLDIILCKKIGHPANPEYAVGSVSLDDIYLDEEGKEISKEYIRRETQKIKMELSSRLLNLTPDGRRPDLKGKNVIIVDDGIATGRTLMACISEVKKKKPAQVIIAVPVASNQAAALIDPLVDEFLCLITSRNFQSVGQFYEYFPEVTDDEVKRLLAKGTKTPDGVVLDV